MNIELIPTEYPQQVELVCNGVILGYYSKTHYDDYYVVTSCYTNPEEYSTCIANMSEDDAISFLLYYANRYRDLPDTEYQL